MATLQEVLDDVTWILARPDLTARIAHAVSQATLECHNLGFFAKDLRRVELLGSSPLGYFIDDSQLILQVPVREDIAFAAVEDASYKFRAVHKIRLCTDATLTTCAFDDFKDRAVDCMYDDFKRTFANYYQVVGNNLRINFGSTPEFVELEYFALPCDAPITIDEVTYAETLSTDWMIQDYPDLVIARAVIKMGLLTGNGDLTQAYRAMIPELHDRIYTNEITVR